jgi:hypothetical protein
MIVQFLDDVDAADARIRGADIIGSCMFHNAWYQQCAWIQPQCVGEEATVLTEAQRLVWSEGTEGNDV